MIKNRIKLGYNLILKSIGINIASAFLCFYLKVNFCKLDILSNNIIFLGIQNIFYMYLWFFGDFRCGVLLFMAILVIYKYENR